MNYYYPPLEQPQPSYYQLVSEDYDLIIRQQPRDALLAQDGKEKNRKPVDPPPIIEVTVREAADPVRQFLQSPYLFMTCSLVGAEENYGGSHATDEKGLCGTMVSSLHKLKDVDNKDGGFFVFGDVSVKRLGEHKLLFSLFELRKTDFHVHFLKSIVSDPFTVHPQKEYPGLEESTHLSRTFADQGVRLRLRKEARTMGGASGRKRSYQYQSQSQQGGAQAGPSRQTGVTRTPSAYASPVVSSTYTEYGEPDTKRQRPDSMGQYAGYPAAGQTLPSQSSMPNLGSLPSVYGTHSPMPRMHAQQTLPSHLSPNPGRYSQFYGQGPSSAPPPGSDFSFRSGAYPRLESADAAHQQQSASGLPQSDYERSGSMGYGHHQQTGSGGMSQMTGFQAPPASGHGHPGLNPSASPYQSASIPYGSVPDPSGYQSYSNQPQYRGEQAYSSGGVGQQSYASESQMPQQQQYGDMSQGYPSSFDAHGRATGYQPPTSRGW